jgi:hypothetical protein
MKFRLILIATLVAGLIPVGRAVAQERATIQALATVVSSLSVIGTNDLQFGTVTPGVSKAVNKNDIGFAGEWTITGTSAAEISIDFTLPAELLTTDSLGRLLIDFRPTDASYSDGTGSQSIPTGVLDPNGPAVQRIGAGGQVLVWIGGVVYPRISQTGGDYSAEIMLTVAYTGS